MQWNDAATVYNYSDGMQCFESQEQGGHTLVRSTVDPAVSISDTDAAYRMFIAGEADRLGV